MWVAFLLSVRMEHRVSFTNYEVLRLNHPKHYFSKTQSPLRTIDF